MAVGGTWKEGGSGKGSVSRRLDKEGQKRYEDNFDRIFRKAKQAQEEYRDSTDGDSESKEINE